MRRFLADLPLVVAESMSQTKKLQSSGSIQDPSKPKENEGQSRLDNLSRGLTAYFAITKRLIDLDDAIDIEGVEFDPNIDEIEWQSLRPNSLMPQKLQKQSKLATFLDCVAKNRKIYEIIHDKDLISRILRCSGCVTRPVFLEFCRRIRDLDSSFRSKDLDEASLETIQRKRPSV